MSIETSLGRWDGVTPRLARESLLDPRSVNTARRLAAVHAFLRNYPAADSAADRTVALAPTSPAMVSLKVLVTLARGDLDSARAVISSAAGRIDRGILFPFFASYQDLYWVLDDGQQLQVLASPPSAFDDDRGSWGLVQAIGFVAIAAGLPPVPTRHGTHSRSRAGPHRTTGRAACCWDWRWRIWGGRRRPCAKGSGVCS